MENLDALWQQLENPIPTCMEYVPNASVQIEQLEMRNETSSYLLIGCLILLTGVAIYAMVDANRRAMQTRM
jgi:hypothetical protein